MRDGKQSPGAWMYVGHDPFEPMTVVVPEGEAGAAREALELEEPAGVPAPEEPRGRDLRLIVVGLVVLVLVLALLRAQLIDVLPFLGEP